MKIAFLGDISLNDDYIKLYNNGENPFEEIETYLKTQDLVVGNLECMSMGNKGENVLKSTYLRTTSDTLNYLKKLNLKIATLANNHVYDNLESGFEITTNFLKENDIKYVGAFLKSDTYSTKILENEEIIILNYVHLDTNPSLPNEANIHVNIYNKEKIINELKVQKNKNKFIVLILHWGLDNSRFPIPWQRTDAKDFINEGADLIVGHHSHVLQGYEIFKGKYVFYGLGNFAFSRHFNNGKYYEFGKRQRSSIIVNLDIQQSKKVVSYTPIQLEGLNVVMAKKNKIPKLSMLIPLVSNILIWTFYKVYLNIFYKIWFYFFGVRRNPIKQLFKIDFCKINRLLQILKIKH